MQLLLSTIHNFWSCGEGILPLLVLFFGWLFLFVCYGDLLVVLSSLGLCLLFFLFFFLPFSLSFFFLTFFFSSLVSSFSVFFLSSLFLFFNLQGWKQYEGWTQYKEADIFIDSYLVLIRTKKHQRGKEAKPMLPNVWWLHLRFSFTVNHGRRLWSSNQGGRIVSMHGQQYCSTL